MNRRALKQELSLWATFMINYTWHTMWGTMRAAHRPYRNKYTSVCYKVLQMVYIRWNNVLCSMRAFHMAHDFLVRGPAWTSHISTQWNDASSVFIVVISGSGAEKSFLSIAWEDFFLFFTTVCKTRGNELLIHLKDFIKNGFQWRVWQSHKMVWCFYTFSPLFR